MRHVLQRVRWPLVVLVLLACAVRIGFLVVDPHPYGDSGLAADSAEVARQIDDHGRWFETNVVAYNQIENLQAQAQRLLDPAAVDFRAADAHPQIQPEVIEPVGESLVLAGLWEVTGSEHWLPYQLLMIVVSALMTLLVFYIALTLFGRRRTAYLGALFYAVFPPLGWVTTIPFLDAWSVDFTIVITALLVRAREDENPLRWLVGAGIATGLGTYFRPGLLLIAPLVGIALSSRPGWRRALRLAVVPTVIGVLMVVPWTIRNAIVFHRFVPSRTGFGQTLWEGMGELPNNFGAQLNDSATLAQVHAVRPDLQYGTPAYDSYLQSLALHAIRAHPGFYAKLVARRLVHSTLLLRNSDWSASILTPSAGGRSLNSPLVRRVANFLVDWLEPFLFVFSALVILLTWRRFGRAHLILVAVVVATLLEYLVIHIEPRYLVPASFAYLLWTALGIDLLIERVSRRAEPRAQASREIERPLREPAASG